MPQNSILAKLQERIDELTTAVEAQQRILDDLKTKRSEARRQLNLFLDPMACFRSNCNPIYFSASRDSPMLFLNVCRLWRDVALATPRLWAQLVVDSLPRGPNYVELCRLWLDRARTLPLSLTLSGSLVLEQSIQDLVTRHRHQLERLTLALSSEAPKSLPLSCIAINLSEGSHLDSLKTLTIDATEQDVYLTSMREWLNVLRATAGLQSCLLIEAHFQEEGHSIQEVVELNSMSDLHLGRPCEWAWVGRGGTSCAMLRRLTLPALKSLSLTDDIVNEEFLAFLSRSSPPLESLNVAIPYGWTFNFISRCFRLVPSLVSLELCVALGEAERYLPFLDLLKASSNILPNLREITFCMDLDGTASIDYDKVLQMLVFRFISCPTRLESFALRFPDEQDRDFTADLPNDQIKSALQQLVKDGMKIYVGHHENLL
ncbi:hypothetical protein R3P38DRAFT_3271142 [Favolaschia claudopus]|uniref:F-box domain-containing protein n=1 Tax=Favolaschia claudopus TaxID=2862362 RepID=A0AAW0B8K7_9AGAR